MALHFAESVARGVFPDRPIFPRRLGDHPQELAMLRFGFFRVTARPRRHRLHALAVGVSEKAASVARESASSPPIAQEAPNPLQVRMQALFGVGVQRCNERRGLGGGGVERVHAPVGSRRGSGSKFSAKFRRSSAKGGCLRRRALEERPTSFRKQPSRAGTNAVRKGRDSTAIPAGSELEARANEIEHSAELRAHSSWETAG